MMKTIRRSLLSLLFVFIMGNAFGQDEFYNEKVKKGTNKTEQLIEDRDIIDLPIEEYYTEKDYNLKHNIEKKKRNKTYEIDDYGDIVKKEKRKDKKRNGDSFFSDEGVEVVLEVAIIFLAIKK